MAKKIHEYRGSSILVTYDARRCIHYAECVRALPQVFDPEARPWIQPDQAGVDAVTDAVVRCPTGALHFERADGVLEVPATRNVIVLDADGPLYVRGDVEVIDAEGEVVLRDTRVALCRCGASAHKPICDGSHDAANFEAPATIPDPKLRGEDDGDGSGTLRIKIAPNGPLIVEGPVTLVGEDDRCRGSKGALCRCGASDNKPFCDGSHARVEFTAE